VSFKEAADTPHNQTSFFKETPLLQPGLYAAIERECIQR
jgi:hypothetical protein